MLWVLLWFVIGASVLALQFTADPDDGGLGWRRSIATCGLCIASAVAGVVVMVCATRIERKPPAPAQPHGFDVIPVSAGNQKPVPHQSAP